MSEQEAFQLGGVFMPDRPVRFTNRVQFDGPVNIFETVTVAANVANDNSTHFLAVDGTLPGAPTSAPEGIVLDIESAGSTSLPQTAVSSYLQAGYTGSSGTFTHYIENNAAGTGTDPIATGAPVNNALFATAQAITAGTNVGLFGNAQNGGNAFGLIGLTATDKTSATNVAVLGISRNALGTGVAGHFELRSGTLPTFEAAALVADNGAIASPIFLARDNGTKVWTIQDGGSVQGKMGTKALTAAVATGFVRIACAQGARTGGFVKYTIEADDGAEFQVRTGLLPFAIVNKGGTETGAVATVSTATETVAVSSGTLTNTFTIASNAADTMDILAEAASSLVETTLRINYTVELYGNAIVTVTPL